MLFDFQVGEPSVSGLNSKWRGSHAAAVAHRDRYDCRWASGKIMKGAGYGDLRNLLLGVGGMVGRRILHALGFYTRRLHP